MNQVVLIGRLTKDVELSYTPNTQTAVARFTLAVDRPRRNGEEQGADFIRITVFGRQAETSNQYLARGRQAAVAGRIQTGSYKNREGVTVYTTEVVADRVEFLGGGQGEAQRENQGRPQQTGGNMQSGQYSAPVQQGYGYQQDFGFDDLPDTFQSAEDDIPF